MIRIRIYIKGAIAAEQWVTTLDDLTRVDEHHRLIGQADDRDEPWLMEFYDNEAPDETACYRVGTDTDGMTIPVPMTDTARVAELADRWVNQ